MAPLAGVQMLQGNFIRPGLPNCVCCILVMHGCQPLIAHQQRADVLTDVIVLHNFTNYEIFCIKKYMEHVQNVKKERESENISGGCMIYTKAGYRAQMNFICSA